MGCCCDRRLTFSYLPLGAALDRGIEPIALAVLYVYINNALFNAIVGMVWPAAGLCFAENTVFSQTLVVIFASRYPPYRV